VCIAASTSPDALPFTFVPGAWTCWAYYAKRGDSLARLAALGRIDVASIIKDNWKLDLLNIKSGMGIWMCRMPHIPHGEPHPSNGELKAACDQTHPQVLSSVLGPCIILAGSELYSVSMLQSHTSDASRTPRAARVMQLMR